MLEEHITSMSAGIISLFLTFIKFPTFISLHTIFLNFPDLYIFVIVPLVERSFRYLFNSSIKSKIIPIDITIIKGIRELLTDFVDNILMQDKIDVIKKKILKRLFILCNIEPGKKVKLNNKKYF